jgi:branched-chain amino acid transport system substrate-binding protein
MKRSNTIGAAIRDLWLAILVVSLAMFTTVASAQDAEIKIGVLNALTGPLGHMGEADGIGMQIAVDEINQRGGVLGKKIKLIVEDNEGNPAKAVTGATKLIQKDNVSAIIGCEVSFTTLAALQVTTQAKIVQFSQGATADVMSSPQGLEKYPYFFRMGLGDSYTAKKLLDYGRKHYQKIAVLSDSGPAGQSFKMALESQLAGSKVVPVLWETHTIGSPDKSPELLKIRAKGADAIIIQAMPGDAISVLKGMNQIGYKAQILGHLGFGETGTLGAAKDLSGGVITLVSHDSKKKTALEFIEKYKKRTGVTMEAWGRPMQGYDSVMILAEALKRANLDKTKLKEAIESIRDYKPVSGTVRNVVSFGPKNHDGNQDEGPVLVKIVNGDWVTME